MSRFALVLLTVCLAATFTFGADGAWNVSSGNWSAAGSWSPAAVPDGTATFNLAGGGIATVDANALVSTVNVTGVAGWTWNGTSTLTVNTQFNYGSSGVSTFSAALAGNATINVNNGTLKLTSTSNALTGAINIASGARLEATDGNTGTGTVTLNGGTLKLGSSGAGTPTGLVAWYNFADGTANDISGNGNNGTLVGGATITNGALDLTSNGSGPASYMQLPNLASSFSTAGSLVVWTKLSQATPGNQNLTGFCDIGGTGSNNHYPWNGDGQAHLNIFHNGRYGEYDNNTPLTLSASIDRTAWHMVSVTSGADWRFYQNTDNRATYAGGFTASGSSWRIGSGNSGNGYLTQGMYDQIMIFNRQLSASEIADLYAMGREGAFGKNYDNDVTVAESSTIETTAATKVKSLTMAAGRTLITTGAGAVTFKNGTTLGGAATFNIGGGDINLGTATGTAVTLTKTGAGNLILAGASLDTASTIDVREGNLLFSTGAYISNVAFNGGGFGASAGNTVALDMSKVTVGSGQSLIFNGAGTVNINGAITGTQPVVLAGGTLALNNSSGTAINNNLTANGGTVVANYNEQFGLSAVVQFNAGSTYNLNGKTQTINAITFNGGAVGGGTLVPTTVTFNNAVIGAGLTLKAGTVILPATATAGFNTSTIAVDANGGTTTFNVGNGAGTNFGITGTGGIAGMDLYIANTLTNGSFAYTGNGTTQIGYNWNSSNNTYTGTTSILSGTVMVCDNVSVSANGPFGNASSAIVLGSTGGSATLEAWGWGATWNRDFTISGPATIGIYNIQYNQRSLVVNGAISVNDTLNVATLADGTSAGNSVSLNGIISGAGAVNATDATGGGVFFGGASTNTYTGTMNVLRGTTVFAKTGGALATSGDAVVIGGGAFAAQLRTDQPNQFAANTVAYINTNGTLNVNGQAQTINRVVLGGGTLSGGAITVTNTISGSGTISATTLTVGGALTLTGGSVTTTGAISIGGGISLTNANWTSSNVAISLPGLALGGTASWNANGQTVAINGPLSIGTGQLYSGDNTVTLGGDVTGTATNGSGSIGYIWQGGLHGGLNLGGATRTFNIANGTAEDDLIVYSAIAPGSGTAGIIKTGLGTLILENNNTFNGGIDVREGYLKIARPGGMGVGTTTINVGSGDADAGLYLGADIDWGTSEYAQNIVIVAGAGARKLGTSDLGGGHGNPSVRINGSVTLNKDVEVYCVPTWYGGPFGLNGAVTGVGGITKTGFGSLTLTSTLNTFSGALTIKGGMVYVAPGAAGTPSAGNETIIIGDTVGSLNAGIGAYYPTDWSNQNTTINRPVHVIAGNNGTATIGGANTNSIGLILSGPVTLDKDTILAGGTYQPLYLDGVVSGAGKVTKSGANSVYFRNTSVAFQGGFEAQSSWTQWQYSPATNSGGDVSFGGGSITLSGGAGFEFRTAATAGTGVHALNLTNAITVLESGGQLSGNQRDSYFTVSFTGPIDLRGNLTVGPLWEQWGTGGDLHYTGTIMVGESTVSRPGIQQNKSNCPANSLIEGNIVDGAGYFSNPLFLSSSVGTLTIKGTHNTYSRGTVISAGTVSVSATSSLGTGNVIVMPGATLLANSAGNISGLVSVAGGIGGKGSFGVAGNYTPAFTADCIGTLGINTNTFDAVSDMSSLGSGNMSLGSITGGKFTGSLLKAGAGSTYRLGGGGGQLEVTNGVLTGSANLEVNGSVKLSASNDFIGNIAVNSGGLLVAKSLASGSALGNAGNAFALHNGGLQINGNAGNPTVNVGPLSFDGTGTINAVAEGGNVTVQIDRLNRNALGQLAIYRSDANQKIFVTNIAPVAANGMVSPMYSYNGDQFANYDSTNGFTQAAYTCVSSGTTVTLATATATNVFYTNRSEVLTAPVEIYAGKFENSEYPVATLSGTGGSLTIGSGGLIVQQYNFGVPVIFTGEAVVNTTYPYNAALAFNSTVTASNGVSKMGPGWIEFNVDNTATLTGTITVNSGSILIKNGLDSGLGAASNKVVMNGGYVSFAGGYTSSRNFEVGVNGGSFVGQNQGYQIDGAISGVGSLSISAWDNGSLRYTLSSSNNTWSGGTYIASSGIKVNANSSLGTGDVFVAGAGALWLKGDANLSSTAHLTANGTVYFSGSNPAVAAIDGLGTLSIGAGGTGTSSRLTIGGDNSSSSFYGNMSNGYNPDNGQTGTGSFRKVGSGTFTMYGTSSISGVTTVDAGTYCIKGAVTGPVTVNQNGTLSGSGLAGAVSVVGGKIVAGNGIGILHAGSMAFSQSGGNNAQTDFTLAGNGGTAGVDYPQFQVSGNVTGLSNLAINVSLPIPSGTVNPDVISGNTYHVITSGNDVSSQSLGAVNVNWPNVPYGWQVNATTTAGGVDLTAYWVALPGDADLNGVIDGGDYDLLIGYFGMPEGADWTMGDFDYNGIVDGGDYDLLIGYFGNTYPGIGGSNVPEPTTMGLLAIGVVGLISRRRSNRK